MMINLKQAFITATDSENNIARINVAHITHIEGMCEKKEYESEPGERTKIRSLQSTWNTRETPEEVYTLILQAQKEQLEAIKNSRLSNHISLASFNAYACFYDEDECTNYVASDSIVRIDDEGKYSQIKTTQNALLSINTITELSASIEQAENTRIKMLQKYALGIK